jgi:ABC-2 type transport system permease protein
MGASGTGVNSRSDPVGAAQTKIDPDIKQHKHSSMRMVFNIAKAELRNLFYSPVAWFLLIAFMVQCGYFYTTILTEYANWQDIYIKNNPRFTGWDNIPGFTRVLFLQKDGFFSNVSRNLYLFIPLLTMGQIGREVQNGTIKLLYSSPLKLRQIVLGKYMAIMIYNIIMVLVIGIFMVTAVLNIKAVDYGMLLSAALGFYLLTCAYTAIGTFMSSITTYQIVAAIGTFLIVFTLSNIGSLWQKYDIVRDLTFFLHLTGRTEKMLLGLITTKDVIYFLVVVGMFLAFTILKLRAAREAKPWYVKIRRYCVVIALALLTGYISSRPMLTGYWDTTAQDINTIHEKTQQIIKEMGDEKLEVTLYTNLLGSAMGAGLPEARNAYLSNLWEPYLRFKPDIQFNYVYYYDYDSTIQQTGLHTIFPGKSLDYMAEKLSGLQEIDIEGWLKPADMQQKIDLRPEKLRLVMQLKYKGRTEFLRTYDDNILWPEEHHVAAALRRLLDPDFPRAAFITGHYERSIDKTGEREYRIHTAGQESRAALVNLGFDVDTISLDRDKIPANITTLVLADPKSELSAVCLEKIQQYLDKGGNMFILGEPDKQQIVNPVLEKIGLHLMDGTLVRSWDQEMPHMLDPYLTNAALSLMEYPSSSAFRKVKGEWSQVLMQGATAIAASDSIAFEVTPLLRPVEKVSWLKKGKLVVDSAKVEFMPAEGDVLVTDTSFNYTTKIQPGKTDLTGVFPTGLALHRTRANKEQRIIVCGDADFLSNTMPNQIQYGLAFHGWLANGSYPVFMPRPAPPDRLLTITGKTAGTLGIIYKWILPGLVLLAGSILLIRRKRK